MARPRMGRQYMTNPSMNQLNWNGYVENNRYVNNYSSLPYGGYTSMPMHINNEGLYSAGTAYLNGNYHTSYSNNNPTALPLNHSIWALQNPLQQSKNPKSGIYHQPYSHPYPKQSMTSKPTSNVNSIMNSFKTQDGQLDFNKMMNTAGQMMNTVQQVSGLVKGFGGIFKV